MRFAWMWMLPLVFSCSSGDKSGAEEISDTYAASSEDVEEDNDNDNDNDEPGNCTALGGICDPGAQYQCDSAISLSGECGTFPGPAVCCLEPVACGPADAGLCMIEQMSCPTLTDVGGMCDERHICCDR